jgi:hypothetical protein
MPLTSAWVAGHRAKAGSGDLTRNPLDRVELGAYSQSNPTQPKKSRTSLNQTGGTVYQSKLSPEFLTKMDALQKGFEPAWAFLSGIAADRVEDFWLSTAQNAHLYYRDGYYVYIKPSKLNLELHAEYNSHIHQDTKDNHHLLFVGPIKKLMIDSGEFKDKWASAIPGGYVVKSTTPPEFFGGLLELVRSVHE